jgi:hypothetical protein
MDGDGTNPETPRNHNNPPMGAMGIGKRMNCSEGFAKSQKPYG